jgi:Rieske Fe-S protein
MMKRKEFIKTCSMGCLGIIGATTYLSGCSSLKYIDAPINGTHLEIPTSAFVYEKSGVQKIRDYIVLQNENLQYPVFLYRKNSKEYQALVMKCTHQGTELQAFGDRLQCPAHGSEFTVTGEVQNGPADEKLRNLPVTIQTENLLISLK